MTASSQSVLVTVTGPDTPGITAKLAHTIADSSSQLMDIEQVVVGGQLTLCLLVEVSAEEAAGESILKELLFAAKNMGLEMHFTVLSGRAQSVRETRDRLAVTVIGDQLGAKGLASIADVLVEEDANIETIQKLSTEGLKSMEIILSLPSGNEGQLKTNLLMAVAGLDIDIAVQRETLLRREKRLVVMDMDSTLIQVEVIDELGGLHGVQDEIKAITKAAMAGELDFEQSLRKRVSLLKGLPLAKAISIAETLPLMDGAPELIRSLRKLGYKTAVISGGFMFAAERLRDRLKLDYAYANILEVADGVLTGGLVGPIVTPQRKADLLQTISQGEGISLAQTIAVGDGANDLAMLNRAGLGVAFHAKQKLRDAADTALNAGGLDRLLYLLGYHERDIAQLAQ